MAPHTGPLAVASTAGDVTASVRVACGALALNGSDITSRAIVGELVEAADTAMYEAKRSGGNQSRRA